MMNPFADTQGVQGMAEMLKFQVQPQEIHVIGLLRVGTRGVGIEGNAPVMVIMPCSNPDLHCSNLDLHAQTHPSFKACKRACFPTFVLFFSTSGHLLAFLPTPLPLFLSREAESKLTALAGCTAAELHAPWHATPGQHLAQHARQQPAAILGVGVIKSPLVL